jgi:hypothetical protein
MTYAIAAVIHVLNPAAPSISRVRLEVAPAPDHPNRTMRLRVVRVLVGLAARDPGRGRTTGTFGDPCPNLMLSAIR